MELDEIDKAFEKMLAQFPHKRKEWVARNGDKLLSKVQSNIQSRIQDKTGNLKRSVYLAIGSAGGYAAIRHARKIAPHMHLVENGHKVVKNRKIVGWVAGKHLFRDALLALEEEIINDAQKMLDEVVKEQFD